MLELHKRISNFGGDHPSYISGMYVTDVMGPTPGMIALPTPCGNQSRKGKGKEIVTVEAQSRAPLPESEDHVWPLPTPINVQRLEDTFANHPGREFVSRLGNNLFFFNTLFTCITSNILTYRHNLHNIYILTYMTSYLHNTCHTYYTSLKEH